MILRKDLKIVILAGGKGTRIITLLLVGLFIVGPIAAFTYRDEIQNLMHSMSVAREESQNSAESLERKARETNEGWSALMYAAVHGRYNKVIALLEAGADVNARRNVGKSALTFATEQGHQRIAEILQQAASE